MPANVQIDSVSSNALQNLYPTLAFYTEDSGNASNVNNFTIAGSTPGGNSSYAFGLLQFNIGTNTNAQKFLLSPSIGFNQSQVNALKGASPISSASVQADDSQFQTNVATPAGQIT